MNVNIQILLTSNVYTLKYAYQLFFYRPFLFLDNFLLHIAGVLCFRNVGHLMILMKRFIDQIAFV